MRATWTILAATGAIALAAPATPAFGAGFSMSLSASSTPVVGKSMVLEATEAVPAESVPTLYFFSRATIPEEARAGIRGCRALLSRPEGCIRRVVRQANARCRRLPTERRRATCLRAVRRVAGRGVR
jgi:hypothetical protein